MARPACACWARWRYRVAQLIAVRRRRCHAEREPERALWRGGVVIVRSAAGLAGVVLGVAGVVPGVGFGSGAEDRAS